MGMFDQVLVPCPACGEQLVFQSKSGERVLGSWHIENAPQDVLVGLDGKTRVCSCGLPVSISIIKTAVVTTS